MPQSLLTERTNVRRKVTSTESSELYSLQSNRFVDGRIHFSTTILFSSSRTVLLCISCLKFVCNSSSNSVVCYYVFSFRSCFFIVRLFNGSGFFRVLVKGKKKSLWLQRESHKKDKLNALDLDLFSLFCQQQSLLCNDEYIPTACEIEIHITCFFFNVTKDIEKYIHFAQGHNFITNHCVSSYMNGRIYFSISNGDFV